MPYRPIQYSHITNSTKSDVFRRANMYLADVYSMLGVRPNPGGGRCNFSIVLVLVCVVDALARDIHPTIAVVDDHEQRFKKLVRESLQWGPSTRKWLDKGQAAKWLYCEFRNPLTHELGKDVGEATRPAGIYEPAVHLWTNLPKLRVDSLDALQTWNDRWPVMRWEQFKDGRRVALSAAALYWAVKRLTMDLAATCS